MKKATDKRKTPRRDKRVFNGILAGLKEVAAHKRGEIKLNSYLVPSLVDVKAIRNKVGLSQSEFSARYGFPIRTLQDWELGRNQPRSGQLLPAGDRARADESWRTAAHRSHGPSWLRIRLQTKIMAGLRIRARS